MNLKTTVFGPPATGKTTQAERIAEAYNIPHITTGQILREHKYEKTEYGRPVDYMDKGKLVPDELMIHILMILLRQPDYQQGFVLDGFPRTIKQAEALHEIHELDIAFLIDTEEYRLIERMGERMTCPNCDESYNLKSNPPERYGVCDTCGTELEHRTDDNREVLQQKIQEFREKTAKLVDFYEAYGILERINGNKPIDGVWQQIKNAIDSQFNAEEQR